MTRFLAMAIYLGVGGVGGYGHYLKKRYLDNTTRQTFCEYLTDHKKSTFHALLALFAFEYSLASISAAQLIAAQNFITSFLIGYASDSALNRAHDPNQNLSKTVLELLETLEEDEHTTNHI